MRLYQPSNGTEGMIFTDVFCDRCAKENSIEEKYCSILTRTLVHDAHDKEYPKEWVCDDDYKNAKCTAFVDKNKEPEKPVDNETMPLFE
jgi:hypothetical protein